MPPPSSLRRELKPTAETLLIAILGGGAAAAAGLPAGLVMGSMLAVALAALIGRPMTVMLPIARASFVLVGVLLGAVVTPEMIKGIADWPASVALLVVSTLVMFLATACYLRFVHGWEPLSALLGASPGSMAQVMALSAEFNADLRGIAVVQVMRVLLIVIGLPAAWRWRAPRSTQCRRARRRRRSANSQCCSSCRRRQRRSCSGCGFPAV